jgi:hypothetical protein
MGPHPGTTFGKREIHRVWSEQRGVFVCASRVRGWTVALLFALVSAGLGLAAFRLIEAAPSGGVFVAVGLALLSFASLWWALRTLRAVATRRPLMRLEPGRLAVHAASGDIVFHWEDVSLAFGRFYLTIRESENRGTEQQAPRKISVPVLLLPGGSAGLRRTIASVRPDVLDRSAA